MFISHAHDRLKDRQSIKYNEEIKNSSHSLEARGTVMQRYDYAI